MQKTDDNRKNQKHFSKLLPYITKHRFWLILLIFCAILGGFMEVIFPFFLLNLTNTAINNQFAEFQSLLLWAVLFMFMKLLHKFLYEQSSNRYEILTIRDFRNLISTRIQKLPISFIETFHSGDLVSRLNNDVDKITELLRKIYILIMQPIVFILGFIYMALISWKLLLATIILIPISAILFNKVIKPIGKNSKKELEEIAKANIITQDAIRGNNIIKAFNLENTFIKKFSKTVKKAQEAGLEIEKSNAISVALFIGLRYIPQLVCPLYGGYLAYTGEITVGGLLASMSLIWLVFLPIENILDSLKVFREVTPAINRIFEILEHSKENSQVQSITFDHLQHPIEIKNLVFNYSKERMLLDNLNLQIKEGETTALVGPSGCGKSTILKILCGFYEPQEGEIRIYGNNLFLSNLSQIRSKISLVSQESYLFPTTIKENIGYGKIGATDDEIISAAKYANAHNFIMQLPNGYETEVGEWGSKLSGGEKQRIALARAILKDAPILLLDEPTSALDNVSEAIIQNILEKYMKNKTVIIVAHRLSSLKHVDNIVVLNNGKIVEKGTHDELLGSDGLYKRLYLKQMNDMNSKSKKMEGAIINAQ
ncbi:ABC transporter ATP-binding protein [Candidatus Lokiarchaeum ossiferum]|uniref:ABC transporter ATP-binding protein n=1 Tax=Candidatus Lokiarchaeum ossiferum TaxID=2951803 RepID=UPI00352F8EAA